MNEFEIIDQYFNRPSKRSDVLLSVGDDCALLTPPKNKTLAVSIDTLIENTHFFPGMPAADLGYKSLAVSLSDLAAMGAEPAWVMLSLVLPNIDEPWLKDFSEAFLALAEKFKVDLIGGNMSRGPLNITTQVTGFVDNTCALRRDQAKAGDLIYVSGYLGAAGGALKKQTAALLQRWYRPEPRIELGLQLRAIANAAIDISDGLTADLQHVLTKSQVGALIDVEKIPVEPALFECFDEQEAINLALTSGEAYELCFTVPEARAHLVPESCVCIGRVDNETGLRVKYKTGKALTFDNVGYQHF